uniref:(northern house mosquito) hypothetical protein n=1 Tax=Culex pipiens TaxID=7175 RepID=A0A8D8B4Z2_CULPI
MYLNCQEYPSFLKSPANFTRLWYEPRLMVLTRFPTLNLQRVQKQFSAKLLVLFKHKNSAFEATPSTMASSLLHMPSFFNSSTSCSADSSGGAFFPGQKYVRQYVWILNPWYRAYRMSRRNPSTSVPFDAFLQ